MKETPWGTREVERREEEGGGPIAALELLRQPRPEHIAGAMTAAIEHVRKFAPENEDAIDFIVLGCMPGRSDEAFALIEKAMFGETSREKFQRAMGRRPT